MFRKIVKSLIYFTIFVLIFCGIYTNFLKLNNKDEIPSLSGFTLTVVKTEGMKNTAKHGDFVFLKKEKYKKDDVITYQKNGLVASAKVIEIKESDTYILKTDTSETNFSLTETQILGKVLLSLDGWGKVWEFLMNPIVTGVLVIGAFGYILGKLIAQ